LIVACCAAAQFMPGGLRPVLAACTPGLQCEVSGYAEALAANSSFNAIGTGFLNAALVSTNGGSITGTQITAAAPQTSSSPSYFAAYMDSGGGIHLSDSTLTGRFGLYAVGTGSAATLTGGSVNAVEQAVWLHAGASAVLSGVDVDNAGGAAVQISGTGNSFTMTGGKIAAASNAIYAINGVNTIVLNNVDLIGSGGAVISTAGGGMVTIHGGTITHNYTDSHAITAGLGALTINGTQITSAAGGISISDNTGHFSNVDITLTGTGSQSGLRVSLGSSATLDTGSISTLGDAAFGIFIEGNSVAANPLTANNITLTTNGHGATALWASGSGTSTLTDMTIATQGNFAHGLYGDHATAVINMTGGTIDTAGGVSYGVYAANGAQIHLDDVKVRTAQVSAVGAVAFNGSSGSFKHGEIDSQGYGVVVIDNALMDIEASKITSHGVARMGLWVQGGSTATVKNHSDIRANGIGLYFLDAANAVNTVALQDSSLISAQSFAVAAQGGTNTLNAINSTIRGDALVFADNAAGGMGSRLTLNANKSQLFGHADIVSTNESRLSLNLANNSVWTIRPSAGGAVQSRVSFLNLNDSDIVFDPQGSGLYQELRVGFGDLGGSTAVYNAGTNAGITMNTVLNAGGALANQQTDRLIINGDVTGTTLLTVNAATGSVVALTGLTASDGISLVQVYGNANATAFALNGGYAAVGPYQYHLYAFDPGSSDAAQRVEGTGGFWDFRLQNSNVGGLPPLVPQVSSYLAAPTALFQARRLDVGTLHRRVGDTQDCQPYEGASEADANVPCRSEAFLRAYGGDYGYRASHSPSQSSVDAGMRYAAVQGGGNVYAVDTGAQSLRVGLAGSYGELSFEPQRVAGSRKTRMNLWAVSPTLTWQHASGGYVDALVSYGGFKGDVATSARGKTATLQGTSIAASIEAGMPMQLADLTVEPQIQAVWQRLKFDRKRDVDGFPIDLGTLDEWTLRAGGEIRKIFHTSAGSTIRGYGKLHVAHTVNDKRKVWLGDTFQVGKSGTVVQAGLGVDAALAGGKTVVYADVTRQQRVSHAGHQGWAANLGVKIRF